MQCCPRLHLNNLPRVPIGLRARGSAVRRHRRRLVCPAFGVVGHVDRLVAARAVAPAAAAAKRAAAAQNAVPWFPASANGAPEGSLGLRAFAARGPVTSSVNVCTRTSSLSKTPDQLRCRHLTSSGTYFGSLRLAMLKLSGLPTSVPQTIIIPWAREQLRTNVPARGGRAQPDCC